MTAYFLYIISQNPKLKHDAIKFEIEYKRRIDLIATLIMIVGFSGVFIGILAIYNIIRKMNNKNNDKI